MKTCVVNVATKEYRAGQDRLKNALDAAGETGLYMPYIPSGWPQHKDVPYAFRACALDLARARGFDTLLWCDASIVPVASLYPLWEIIDRDGYLVFCAEGGMLSTEAFGLSMKHPKGIRIFWDYYAAAAKTTQFCESPTAERLAFTYMAQRAGAVPQRPPSLQVTGMKNLPTTILVRDPLPIIAVAEEKCPPEVIVNTSQQVFRRFVTERTPGQIIPWALGDPAWHKKDGRSTAVTIASGVVGHPNTPGEACYEVLTADETLGHQSYSRICVRATELEIRTGWKP